MDGVAGWMDGCAVRMCCAFLYYLVGGGRSVFSVALGLFGGV